MYEAETSQSGPIWRCTTRFHCCTYIVWTLRGMLMKEPAFTKKASFGGGDGSGNGSPPSLPQRIRKPSGGVQQRHQIPERRDLAEPPREIEHRLLVEDAVRAANHGARAAGLPRDAQ